MTIRSSVESLKAAIAKAQPAIAQFSNKLNGNLNSVPTVNSGSGGSKPFWPRIRRSNGRG